MKDRMNRREFLETSGKAALGVGLGVTVAGALATPARAQAPRVGANDKILMGAIGVGGMGTGNMNAFMEQPEVEVVAVCDVDSNFLNRAAGMVEGKYGRKPKAFKDFRELLDMKEIDAVMIGTPDHWHALPFITACEAGKDVFCEKPISHDIWEGRQMVGAAKRFGRVSQINTWQRSVGFFRQAIDFVRSGGMGKVRVCRAWVNGPGGLGKNPIKDPPANLDWDFWCGPAPKNPYHDTYHPGMWRLYYDYGTGMSGDWGVHMIDIILLGMNATSPLEVAAVGGKLFCDPDDDRDSPDTMMAVYRFPDWVMNWEIKCGGEGLDGSKVGHGAEFIGEKGKMIVTREGIDWTPYGDNPGPQDAGKDQGGDAPNRWSDANHIGDFLENVKTRGKCRSDIESMYYTTTACHLSNLAYQAGRSIKWDGAKGEVIGDRKAMSCRAYKRDYRRPWKLPKYEWS
ncbi:MAG: Gfo/Idh/MocA family oxidoreductase [Armatimonadetes bacterium]|nr:Gfo/Idh/MocA family oxidoreductase [Armatimonadota bacterium]